MSVSKTEFVLAVTLLSLVGVLLLYHQQQQHGYVAHLTCSSTNFTEKMPLVPTVGQANLLSLLGKYNTILCPIHSHLHLDIKCQYKYIREWSSVFPARQTDCSLFSNGHPESLLTGNKLTFSIKIKQRHKLHESTSIHGSKYSCNQISLY